MSRGLAGHWFWARRHFQCRGDAGKQSGAWGPYGGYVAALGDKGGERVPQRLLQEVHK